MLLAILSDIHDHLWNLAPAIRHAAHAGALICCGDLCSPFVIDELAKFPRDVHIVFGNNDADLYRITSKASRYGNIHLHGEFFEATFDGARTAVNHFDSIARPIARSGSYDLVCFGHNHELEISREGDCTLINPGTLFGAKFTSGAWEDTPATFVVYDTATRRAEVLAVLEGRVVEHG